MARDMLHRARAGRDGMGGSARNWRGRYVRNLPPRLYQGARGGGALHLSRIAVRPTRIVGIAPKDVKSGMRMKVRRGAQDRFPLFMPT